MTLRPTPRTSGGGRSARSALLMIAMLPGTGGADANRPYAGMATMTPPQLIEFTNTEQRIRTTAATAKAQATSDTLAALRNDDRRRAAGPGATRRDKGRSARSASSPRLPLFACGRDSHQGVSRLARGPRRGSVVPARDALRISRASGRPTSRGPRARRRRVGRTRPSSRPPARALGVRSGADSSGRARRDPGEPHAPLQGSRNVRPCAPEVKLGRECSHQRVARARADTSALPRPVPGPRTPASPDCE